MGTHGDAGYDAANLFRNSQAHYFLPSVDEWYKAAFYDPNANGGAGGYWDFPTGSDSVPTAVASGTAAGTAVWDQAFEQGPADITLAGGLSPYGVMGQGGNVWEWEETEYDLDERRWFVCPRGAGGQLERPHLHHPVRVGPQHVDDPTIEDDIIGFRVASIPEPSSLLLGALGTLGLLLWRRSSS